MAFDPSLMIAPDVGGMVQQGIQQGMQTREQNMAKAAMAALVKDPNNANALAALAQVDPERAMDFRKQQLEYAKTQLGQHYDSVVRGGQIARQVNPHDQASWDQTLAMAQQAGIDISQVPRVWNSDTAKYAQQLMGLADAFKPLNSDNLHFITPQPGGGAAIYDPTSQTTKWIIQPNDGSQVAGTPAGPPPQAVDYLKQNPTLAAQFDQKYGAGAAARALGNGGQAATPPATFP